MVSGPACAASCCIVRTAAPRTFRTASASMRFSGVSGAPLHPASRFDLLNSPIKCKQSHVISWFIVGLVPGLRPRMMLMVFNYRGSNLPKLVRLQQLVRPALRTCTTALPPPCMQRSIRASASRLPTWLPCLMLAQSQRLIVPPPERKAESKLVRRGRVHSHVPVAQALLHCCLFLHSKVLAPW